jgi:beta-phosphoglucomutase-like phosphatase (HAD superfamily)
MKMKLPNAAFFDLDDTILGTTECSNKCWKLLSEEYAYIDQSVIFVCGFGLMKIVINLED